MFKRTFQILYKLYKKLKTTVMHQVMETKNYGDYWKNDNLPNCFIDSVQRLLDGLKSGNISDIFFPEVNKLKWNTRDVY